MDVPCSKKTWNGETGRINQEILPKYLNDLRGPIYYIAGPPPWSVGLERCWLNSVSTKTTSELMNLPVIDARIALGGDSPNELVAPV